MRLKPTFVLFSMTCGFVTAVQAMVVVQYSSEHAPEDGSLPAPAAYSTGKTIVSPLAAANDSLERRDGSLNFGGWGSDMTLDGYVGFTVTTEPGFSLLVTHLSFKSLVDEGAGLRGPVRAITSFTLAYRVDDGGGFGAWGFGETYYTVPQGEIMWDFGDVQTTGTIEFALFATSDFPGADLAIDSLNVYGYVPEPAVASLAAISIAAACRRRRRI